jgi:hypothetical protein
MVRPLTVTLLTVPVPNPTADTYPGDPELEVCGAVQPDGTTMVTWEPARKSLPIGDVKGNVKVLFVLPAVTLVGLSVKVPSPSEALPSVKCVVATTRELNPVAVKASAAPAN